MKKKVYIPLDIEEEGKSFLIDKGYDIVIGKNSEKETMMDEVADCEAILTRSNAIIDTDIIDEAKNLKIISKYGVGINNIDVEYATRLGVYVTNTPTANANAVAEFVLSVMSALAKKLFLLDKQTRKGNFDVRTIASSMDLEGKTLGVIGLGRIGKNVAKKAHYGFDMNIVGYDPLAAKPPSFIHQANSLRELLMESDFVTLHLPLLDSTRHIIGKEELKQMKNSAYLINASRGGIADENALVDALKQEEIAGAAVDVFEIEPPEVTNKLFSLNNVIVTPHSAALSKEGTVKMSLHAAIQVDQVLSGKEPSWPVNNIQ